MVVLVTVAMLVSYFGAVLVMYQQIVEIMEQEVGQDAVFISAGADHYGAGDLENIDKALEGTRVTLIAPSGEILYDTYGDNIPLENHADRPEIREAFETGEGDDIRYSNSLGTLMFYAARRTEEGNVLRVSKASRSAFWLCSQENGRGKCSESFQSLQIRVLDGASNPACHAGCCSLPLCIRVVLIKAAFQETGGTDQ